MKLRLPGLFLSLALALSTLGCKQGIGERCQLDSDCDSGHCVLPTGGSAQQGGTCQPTATDDGGSVTPADLISSQPADMATAPGPDIAMTPSMDMSMASPPADMSMIDGANAGG